MAISGEASGNIRIHQTSVTCARIDNLGFLREIAERLEQTRTLAAVSLRCKLDRAGIYLCEASWTLSALCCWP
jgi:hypothetical protein